ncbi:hypothetical protein [Deinococcus yavapaiensis]|uniref:DUF4440 domain-containing protein n=1 Tax=Deinococcus yavapaiensis KR-236 TaxID=694435 RepID=A0A318S1V4_9DEIO|nr:hypothetical protein [Deinococcus yavapaiensis]PYE50464.1 hypothetical protein DES52_11881 [Deinococcus yavapaiensis KR-236]
MTLYEAQDVALAFGQALLARRYEDARALLAPSDAAITTIEDLQRGFETFVPLDWEGEILGADVILTEWPDREEDDVALVYVPIAGFVYSEAVTVVVTRTPLGLRVRGVEFGRP